MDWNPLIEIGKIMGGAIVAIATAWRLVPKIWAKVSGWMMYAMQEQITKMSADIEFIVSELKTNGGASLRDSVIRNEETLNRIESMTWSNVEVQRARMDNDREMIFITDEKGDCTWANRAYARHTGRTIEEVRGSGWINVVHPSQRDRVAKAWYDAIKHNREFEMIIEFMDTADVAFKGDVRSYKMTSAKGETTGYMGVVEVIGAI